MNCESARPLINALIDDQIEEADRVAAEEHLSVCAECQTVADELRQVNESLSEVFSSRRNAAKLVVEKVIAALPAEEMPNANSPNDRMVREVRRTDWRSLALALAVGFVLALVIFPPRSPGPNPEMFGPIARPEVSPSESIEAPAPESSNNVAQNNVAQIATLVARTGQVQIDAESKGWSAVPLPNFRCPSDSRVRTAEGACCELVTSDGAVIRMNGDTEVRLRSPREVELQQGQLFCKTSAGTSIEVFSCEAPAAKQPGYKIVWSAAGAGAEFLTEVSSEGAGIVVSASGSSVSVKTPSEQRQLKPGEGATIVDGKVEASHVGRDAMLSASWIHPLLTQKGHADPELHERVDELLARIGRSKMSMLYEREIRSLGEYCVLPLLRYVQSPISKKEPGRRASAMGIAADLAPAVLIGELLPLLKDDSSEIRFQTARALQRLTNETQGRSPGDWRKPIKESDSVIKAWTKWWEQNSDRYPVISAPSDD